MAIEQQKSPKGRFNSRTVFNHSYETVDAWVYNAGIQAKLGHFHECTDSRDILQYVIDGEGTLECKGKLYKITKYSLFLLPKGVRVRYYANKSNPYRYYWITFSGTYAETLLKQSGLSPDSPVRTVTAPVVKRSFKRIYEYLQQAQGQAEIDCSLQPKILAAFYEIFGALLENKRQSRTCAANELVNRAVSIMKTEYMDGLTVSDVCGKLFVNRTYFSVLFKKYTGTTPVEYLENIRFNEVCRLLKKSDMPLASVADCVGMSLNSLHKMIKIRLHISPIAYRKENKT